MPHVRPRGVIAEITLSPRSSSALVGLVVLLSSSFLACTEALGPATYGAPDFASERSRPNTPDGAEPGDAPAALPVGSAEVPVVTQAEINLAARPSASTEPAEGLLTGNMTCLGANLPAQPTGETRRLTGRTYLFGTPVVAPGTLVTLYDDDDNVLSWTLSDEGGEFSLEVVDDAAARGGYIELSCFGLLPAWHRSTHFAKSWLGGDEVGLSIVSPGTVDLFELATGLETPLDRGAIHGKIFDCDCQPAVANAWITVEPEAGIIFYAQPDLGFSSNEGGTTEVSQFFVFDLDPGDYVVTVWGRTVEEGEPVVVNRAEYRVAAGTLSTQAIHPE